MDDIWARLAATDVYAKELFDDERDNNPRTRFERGATWVELPQADRDEYRKLARNLMKEASHG